MAGPPPQRRELREETRLVLEAFLQGALGRRPPPGHVGRGYHDPHCWAHRCPTEPGAAPPAGGPWTPLHEEISQAEERKHGFRTSVKRLLRRWPSPRRDSPNPPLPPSEHRAVPKEAGQGHPKDRWAFSLKGLLRKKGPPREKSAPPASRTPPPSSLPVTPCYCTSPLEPPSLGQAAEDPEFYARVARKLDRLVQQQLGSPCDGRSPGAVAGPLSPELGPGPPALPEPPSESPKDQVLQRLVALLEQQAGVINEEIEADPLLRSCLSRMSYGSFSRLAEAYTVRAAPGSPSPPLTRLALSMELTRRVAGINSHAAQALMGYSLQYMDMFVPWLQQQGGWESIVGQDEILD